MVTIVGSSWSVQSEAPRLPSKARVSCSTSSSSATSSSLVWSVAGRSTMTMAERPVGQGARAAVRVRAYVRGLERGQRVLARDGTGAVGKRLLLAPLPVACLGHDRIHSGCDRVHEGLNDRVEVTSGLHELLDDQPVCEGDRHHRVGLHLLDG